MDDITNRYRKFDSNLVSDALDQHDIEGVVTDLSPISPKHTTVGRATTIRFEEVETDSTTNFPGKLFKLMSPNTVLIMDCIPDVSCWGGMASRLASNVGVNGIVTNGRVRDADEIYTGEFPVFSSGTTPQTGQQRIRVAATDEPVTLRNQPIESDDIIIADLTGVVVVPDEMADEVAETAERILSEELLIEQKIKNGATHDNLRKHDF